MTLSESPSNSPNSTEHSPWWRRKLTGRQSAIGLIAALVIIGVGTLVMHQTMSSDLETRRRDAQMNLSGMLGSRPEAFRIEPDTFSLIPKDEIRAGGPPKDGIPALTDPKVDTVAEATRMQDDERVIGVSLGNEARAYSLRILNWHEIVNDEIGGQKVAVTYCPLCDSAVVFDRTVDGEVLDFGVSGLLYNSNVLMYDRRENDADESLWSQMLLKAVVGPAAAKGHSLAILPAQLTTWGAWRDQYPETTSLSFETGHARDYRSNPYVQYFATDELMFPVETVGEPATDADSIPPKEPVIIVSIEDNLKGYPVSRLKEALEAGSHETIKDVYRGNELVFTPVDTGRGIYHVTDSDNNPVPTVFSFWFEFRAMHPSADVFEVAEQSAGAALSSSDFDVAIQGSSTPVLVKFEAEWCGVCKAMEPVVSAISTDRADSLMIIHVDIDQQEELVERYSVSAIPDFLVFRDGELVQRRNGFMDEQTLARFLDATLQ